MKIEIINGELRIGMQELVERLTPEDLEVFAQYAVFNEKLMEAIVDTVAIGSCFEGNWWSSSTTESLRMRLLPLLPKVVQALVKDALDDVRSAEAGEKKYRDLLGTLMDHWPARFDKPAQIAAMHQRSDYDSWTASDVDTYLSHKLPGGEWEAIKAKHAAMEPIAAE